MSAATVQRGVLAVAVTLASCVVWGADLCLVPLGGKDCSGFEMYPNEVSWTGFSEHGVPCRSRPNRRFKLFVSASQIDPYVNGGPLDAPELFLWAAGSGYGYREDHLLIDGNIDIVGVEGVSGHAHIQDNGILFWIGCAEYEPECIARLIVALPVATDAPSWGHVKSLYR